jgi:hypothetical protein
MDYEQRVIIRFLHREGVALDEIRTQLKAAGTPSGVPVHLNQSIPPKMRRNGWWWKIGPSAQVYNATPVSINKMQHIFDRMGFPPFVGYSQMAIL